MLPLQISLGMPGHTLLILYLLDSGSAMRIVDSKQVCYSGCRLVVGGGCWLGFYGGMVAVARGAWLDVAIFESGASEQFQYRAILCELLAVDDGP